MSAAVLLPIRWALQATVLIPRVQGWEFEGRTDVAGIYVATNDVSFSASRESVILLDGWTDARPIQWRAPRVDIVPDLTDR